MATSLTFGIQKGGVGKTTTAGITAWLLARNHRVLAVDMDPQGNLAQVLAGKTSEAFEGRTVLEAMKEGKVERYLYRITDNLRLLPSGDALLGFEGPPETLRNLLKPIQADYEFIVIDQPPALGACTLNALGASDTAVILCQTEPMSFNAVPKYLDTLFIVKNRLHHKLFLAGILLVMLDVRSVLERAIVEKAREQYGPILLTPIVKRRSRIKEFSIFGVQERTVEDRLALRPFREALREVLIRALGKEEAENIKY